MRHLDEGTIHAWIDGALSESDAAAAAAHAASCAECAAAVADARGLIAGATRIVSALDVVPPNVIPSTLSAARPSRSLWRVLRLTPARAALAATILVAVSSMIVVRRDPGARLEVREPRLPASEPAAVVAPVTATAPPPKQSPATRLAPHADARRPAAIPPTHSAAVDSTHAIADSSKVIEARPSAAAAGATAPVAASPAAGLAAGSSFARRTPGTPMGANVMQLSEVVTTGLSAITHSALEGCYRINNDTAAWLEKLPERFALQADSARGQNVVRTVTPDGRIDTLVRGSLWRSLSPTVVNVRFNSERSETGGINLVFSAAAVSARASEGSRTQDMTIRRIDCRR